MSGPTANTTIGDIWGPPPNTTPMPLFGQQPQNIPQPAPMPYTGGATPAAGAYPNPPGGILSNYPQVANIPPQPTPLWPATNPNTMNYLHPVAQPSTYNRFGFDLPGWLSVINAYNSNVDQWGAAGPNGPGTTDPGTTDPGNGGNGGNGGTTPDPAAQYDAAKKKWTQWYMAQNGLHAGNFPQQQIDALWDKQLAKGGSHVGKLGQEDQIAWVDYITGGGQGGPKGFQQWNQQRTNPYSSVGNPYWNQQQGVSWPYG